MDLESNIGPATVKPGEKFSKLSFSDDWKAVLGWWLLQIQ